LQGKQLILQGKQLVLTGTAMDETSGSNHHFRVSKEDCCTIHCPLKGFLLKVLKTILSNVLPPYDIFNWMVMLTTSRILIFESTMAIVNAKAPDSL